MKNDFYFMLKALFVLEMLKFLSGFFDYIEKRLKVNESWYIELFLVIGSIKKLFLIDFINIYLFSMLFSIAFADNYIFSIFSSVAYASIYLFSILFSIDFACWKSVGLPQVTNVVIH